MTMKASIIIPNYNGINYIEACLDSLLLMGYQDYELIVIDNASTDGSEVLVSQRNEPMHLICNDTNLGFAAAVNQGIECAKGDYVILLNNDVEVEPDWLERLVWAIEQDERIFAVSSKMLRWHERDIIDDAGDGYNILGWGFKHGDGMNRSSYAKAREVFSACAGAAIYRKSLLDEIGYFDEAFFAYLEDIDLCFRARMQGYKVIFEPSAVVYHIGSATSGSKYNDFKVRLASRNNVYLLHKNMPLWMLVLNSPFLILGDVVKYIFMARAGFGNIFLKGKLEAFKTLKGVKKASGYRLADCLWVEGWMIKESISFVRYMLALITKR